MTTKLQYEAVLAAEDDVANYLHTLKTTISDTDLILGDQITIIENALVVIKNSTNEKLDELAQQQVMSSFLAEMKVVFEKYSAILEVGSSTDGYGVDYGNSVANAGVKFTATLEGVAAVKEIGKVVIVSGDLV